MDGKALDKMAKRKGYKSILDMLIDYDLYPTSRLMPRHTKKEFAEELAKNILSHKKCEL